ncbi:MAG: fibronectin type III domain-containing protein, partial [Gemmatimonadaceae bacterium]
VTDAPNAVAATSITGTSFSANWDATTGAASYRLDVATDVGFTAFVTGFNDRTVAATTESVTGLTENTTYFYRVRAVNAGGTSASSNDISPLTAPAASTANAATAIATTSFDANWDAVTGATGYRLDVATDAGFTAFVAGFSDRSVAGTTETVTGLAGNTTYFYRVRAVNAGGTGANSNDISVLTVPEPPTAIAATGETQTTFEANWNVSAGATSYRLDVSTDPGFGAGTFVVNFEDRVVAGGATATETVTGLAAGTTYHYRVRAVGTNGTSTSSNVITIATLP